MPPDREAVLRTLKEYDGLGDDKFLNAYHYKPSTKYDLIFEGRPYPPKAIYGVAHKYSDGKALSAYSFAGGTQTNKPLKKLDFDIQLKNPDTGYDEDDLTDTIPRDSDQLAIRAIRIRRGQQRFRSKLLRVYRGKCAISGTSVSEILDAAHVRPHSKEGTYSVSNGILLRTDLHALFDLQLLRIDPETLKVVVDKKIKDGEYRSFSGRRIFQPKNPAHRVDIKNLVERWKSD